jgi:dTDP-4-dehydrorhamnose reductase
MQITIIGANGQLGSQLVETFSSDHEVTGLNHSDIEISDIQQSANVLDRIKPDVVINTAAFHHVPKCETEPQTAFKVNAIGALNLAQIAEKQGFTLVHYSTDYVFDGLNKTPYTENDATNPLNMYALTKLNGETLIRNNCRRYFVLRISGIYGNVACRAKGGNFIMTMTKAARERDLVKVVDDEILTPTPVTYIAENTKLLLKHDNYGLFHMTCQDECSWYEFANVIFDTLKLKTPLIACKSDEFPSAVKRPMYSVLENQKLKLADIDQMPHWRDALTKFLTTYKLTN